MPRQAPLRHWQPVHCISAPPTSPPASRCSTATGLSAGRTDAGRDRARPPIGALGGDRFILRDQSATRTRSAAAHVLDIFPPSAPQARARTPRRCCACCATTIRAGAARRCRPASRPASISIALRSTAISMMPNRSGANLACSSSRIAAATLGFDRAALAAARANVCSTALAAEHERAPDMIGVERDRLRRLTLPTLARAAFDRLVAELQAQRPHRADRRLAAPAGAPRRRWRRATADLWRASAAAARCRALPAAARARHGATPAASPRRPCARLMKRVARVGGLPGGARPLLHGRGRGAAGRARRRAYARATVPPVPPTLRDVIGGGRKVAIHILEFFDRVGYTRRVRDEHVRRAAGTATPMVVHATNGRDRSPVGRPVFKTGRGRQAVPGGFDSHSLPPRLPSVGVLQCIRVGSPQHFLNFLPLPQGQGSLRPSGGSAWRMVDFALRSGIQ